VLVCNHSIIDYLMQSDDQHVLYNKNVHYVCNDFIVNVETFCF